MPDAMTDSAYACMPHPRLEAGGLWVAAVQPDDIQAIRGWRNAQMEVLRQSRPISPAQQEAYFAERIWPSLGAAQPSEILLSYRDGERLIGYGGLVHIAWEHRRAEVSFLLDPVFLSPPESYGRYFGVFLGLMQRLAFADLGLERLFTETYALRTHHIAVLETAGFRREGVLRRQVRIAGRAVDSLIHGCLKDDTA